MPQGLQAAPLASRSMSRPSLLMDAQVPLWFEAAYPRLYFLSVTVSNFLYSCIASIVMAALHVARPRLASWNEVPVETFSIFVNFANNSTAMIELSSLGATCPGFPSVAGQVAAKRLTAVN
jgi:hypothetical protein